MSAPHTCDCLDKIEAALVARHGKKAGVSLDLAPGFLRTPGAESYPLISILPALSYSYTRHAKGERAKRIKSRVDFTFCPFCGKKGAPYQIHQEAAPADAK